MLFCIYSIYEQLENEFDLASISLFNGISTFMGYLMPTPPL